MEAESPLLVLSRAATMLQETQQSATEDANKQNANKQLPSAKWKRERRTRAEYSRKSDPKTVEQLHDGDDEATPLDMTTTTVSGRRGLPPSYSQAISDPSFRSAYSGRPSVIFTPNHDDIPSGISMCDPIIDEHFRRSLGKDYNTVFSNNNMPAAMTTPPVRVPPPLPAAQAPIAKRAASPPPPPTSKQSNAATNVIELMDTAGLSVDDHFAKALGDTWLKLNKKDAADLKNEVTT